mgnify:CR=1 FL=1
MDENFLDNRSFESYPDVSYSLPISFGFTVRKDLSRRIAVESGLMYTYLSTTFKRGGDCPSEVKSSLHYLGIPLNLVVYVWKNQRWNVYLSGGFMMEKGLQAVYSGYIAGNGTTISKSKRRHPRYAMVRECLGRCRLSFLWGLDSISSLASPIISTVINRLVFVQTSRWDLG